MFETKSLLDEYCKDLEKKYKFDETKENRRYKFKK